MLLSGLERKESIFPFHELGILTVLELIVQESPFFPLVIDPIAPESVSLLGPKELPPKNPPDHSKPGHWYLRARLALSMLERAP